MVNFFAKQRRIDRPNKQAQAWGTNTQPSKCDGIQRLWNLLRRIPDRGSGRVKTGSGFEGSRIQWTKDVTRSYKLLGVLQASSQPGTKVLRAVHAGDGEELVVKVRNKPGVDTPAFANSKDEDSWRTSMELVLNLPPSPYIARVLDVLEDSRCYYVAMDYVIGTDLGRASRRRRFDNEELKMIIRQLLLALQAMHSSGVLHCDIKLENIVLDAKLSMKLVDFDDVGPYPAKQAEGEIRWVSGTDQYIAPEAYSGEVSAASDLFAAGVVLYKLVFGRFPFRACIFDDRPGENWVHSPAMEAIKARLEDAVVDWSAGSAEGRPAAISFCQKLMALDVRDRFSTASEALAHPWFMSDDAIKPTMGLEACPRAPQEYQAHPHRPSLEELEILTEVVKVSENSYPDSLDLEDTWPGSWVASEEPPRMTRHSTSSTITLDASVCAEAVEPFCSLASDT
mmetsp:Transcript_55573/g.104271  ORF Transcript_55573/g.104271 Transcript_55573/m.104271 type:complete len:452 (-) Transcript_55573:212-1567(-)